MAAAKLKEALNDCIINFDQRVLVTDLINDYELPLKEVDAVLAEFISAQEKAAGTKYEKRFLVHGEEQDNRNEIFTVVQGEAKLKEWLRKLKNVESSLYSVEVAGGAKAPLVALHPVRHYEIKLANPGKRSTADVPVLQANGATTKQGGVQAVKAEAKPTSKPLFSKQTATDAKKTTTKSPDVVEEKKPAKKTSPLEEKKSVKKTSPQDKKPAKKASPEKKPSNKKDIGNFFATTTKASADKSKTAVAPKSMGDFFKKQAEKPAAATAASTKPKTENANVSIQLFDDDDDKEAESSDEDEKLEALRREIITSDHEDDDEAPSKNNKNTKRRRIDDSDDEEPQGKHDKKEIEVQMVEPSESPASVTHVDEDGFLITVKSKTNHRNSSSSAPKKISPPAKAAPKKPAAAAPPAKTKQGNIMNFFTKK